MNANREMGQTKTETKNTTKEVHKAKSEFERK